MRNAMMWCLLACAACGAKKDDQGAGSGAPAGAGTAATGGAGAAAGGAGAAGHVAGGGSAAAGSEAVGATSMTGVEGGRKTRIFECGFVKFDGEGKDRKTVFKLRNLGDRVPDGAQSWIYYYDKTDRLLSRYPHRFFTSLAPGATEEQALGHTGTSIPKDAVTAECEISEVDWKDKTEWANANLSSDGIERPRGGFSHEQLLEREGERVTAIWTGKTAERPVLALKNVSGRPLTAKVVWVYQYDGAGKQLEKSVSNVSIDLEPGAQVEQELGPKGLKAGTKHVEAVASEVRFRDGKQETWRNDNLAPLGERPISAKREAPAPMP
jgi:hypothetical protein